MDLLKVFKVLRDKDIRLSCGNCWIDNLTINDIVYSATDKEYFILSEDTSIIISENLAFQEVPDNPGNYFAFPENGGVILVYKMNAHKIKDSEPDEEVDEELDLNELDELDIQLDFDESDFLEE